MAVAGAVLTILPIPLLAVQGVVAEHTEVAQVLQLRLTNQILVVQHHTVTAVVLVLHLVEMVAAVVVVQMLLVV